MLNFLLAGDQKDSKSSGPKSSKPLPKQVFKAETVSQETGVPELSEGRPSPAEEKETEQKVKISHNISADGSSSEISIIESGENSPTSENPMPEISSIHIAVTSDTGSKTSDNSAPEERRSSLSQEVPAKEVKYSISISFLDE